MSTPSSFDRDPFQQFLASAYAVQQSGMDTQSLSALLELQQSLAASAPDADRAMHLIVDRAQDVANASGIAIALLTGDQLVYRAASGCAASFVDHRMTAVLSVSATDQPRSEILRVENAQTDGRIVADVCRQFEAQALLLLPIYHDHAMAGVLQVLFREIHVFEESELRAYRMMVGMVEEAMFVKPGQKRQPSTVPHAIEQITSQMHVDEISAPAPVFSYPVRERWIPLHKFQVNTAVAGIIATLVVVAGWIIYDHRPAAPALASSQQQGLLQTSSTPPQQIMVEPSKPSPLNRTLEAQASARRDQAGAPSPAFKRVWVGPNEVDYVAEDVTIRHFTTIKPPRTPVRDGYREVQFGKDVTVRYFAAKPAVAPRTRPLSTAAQSVERSVPVTK
jgi:hypothetical protein